ncbi:MAG: cobyrinate a,c-diamide synthase [Desulfovibrio sp.]|nr:cobyrinate a,c-diamide synthase [Desulfovibrio sp.]MCA1985584.1 cobyrinate a,c-diamide synthase [Desulfovibrio sp.]
MQHHPAHVPSSPLLVVAGTHSGCGKTSVTLGLLRALTRRGLVVQPFKAGPDFIDPALHALAAGRPSWNLDSWMCPPHALFHTQSMASEHAPAPDLRLLEGVMGLHDGASPRSARGSTAELARLLDGRVLLVADVHAMARSAAALVQGYVQFEPGLDVAGVVLNRVGSARHRSLLAEVFAAHSPGLPVAGMLGRNTAIELPSRHLGLHLDAEADAFAVTLDRLADWVEEGLDLDALLARLACPARHQLPASPASLPASIPAPSVRLAVARDAAFCFVYAENLRRLERAGAELAFFSPLQEARLPEGIHGLYLPGGYPELHAPALAANTAMRTAVQAFARSGRPVYAECGGFMYLLERLETTAGSFPMAGVFPGMARMGERFAALGYREVTTTAATPLGPAGTRCRGHEFHYSFLVDSQPLDAAAGQVYHVTDRSGTPVPPAPSGACGGWQRGNVLGSYIHIHFGSNPRLAPALVAACARA